MIAPRLTPAWSERAEVIEGLGGWTENGDTLHCSNEPAGAAVRRSSDTSADSAHRRVRFHSTVTKLRG